MNITYNINQYRKAEKDVIEIYKLAEEKMKLSPIPYSLVQLRNAFQVFRYAFREWALGNDRGVVLRALMLADARAREVRSNGKEMVIQVDDPDVAIALERLLEGDGYVEEGN
jgi:predicted transcriptional regulator